MHDSHLSAEDYIKEALNLPENMRVESMIAFGYPDEKKASIPKVELQYEKIL